MRNSTGVGTSPPRSATTGGNLSTYNSGSDGGHNHTLSGTVGNTGGANGDGDMWTTVGGNFNSGWMSGYHGGGVNTSDISAHPASVAAFNTDGPSANSGGPSTNVTSTDGSHGTGTANPPYIVLNWIIKT